MSTKEKLQRIGVSLGIVLIIIGLQRLILPGLNYDFLSEIKEIIGNNHFSQGAFKKLKLLTFGINPLLTATAYLLAFYGLFPKVNKMPLSEIRRKVAFPTIIFMTLIIISQSISISAFIAQFNVDGNTLISMPERNFILLGAFSFTLSFFVLLTLLRLARIKGIVSGFTLFLFLSNVVLILQACNIVITNPTNHIGIKIGFIALIIFCAVLSLFIITFKTEYEIRKSERKMKYKLPLRLNLLGLVPLFTVSLPLVIASILNLSSGIHPTVTTISYTYNQYLINNEEAIGVIGLVLTSLVLLLWSYPSKYIENILRKYNAQLAENPHTLQHKLVLYGGINIGMLFLLSLFSDFYSEMGSQGLSLLPISIFLVVLLSKKILKSLINPVVYRKENETTFLEFDTVLEAELLCHDLQSRGIESRVINSRFMEYTGSEAFWEIARPRFIAASANPFLENGSVTVVVHNDNYDAALSYWDEFNSSGQVAPSV